MEKTEYGFLSPSDQARGLPQPPLEIGMADPSAVIPLPGPGDVLIPPTDLRQAIEARRSLRRYSDKPLSLGELSFLLWCSQGVKECRREQPAFTYRTVPSAGARHALETYLVINRVEGLQAGLYRFGAIEHGLAPCRPDPHVADELVEACLGQTMVKSAAATFIWTAVAYRMTWRYAQRGYRYLHLDAGHACQNLYLAAEAVGGGVCAIAAFDDERVNALLGIDGREQFAIYLATVGKKPG